jgi:hypothetical protein
VDGRETIEKLETSPGKIQERIKKRSDPSCKMLNGTMKGIQGNKKGYKKKGGV